MKNTNFVMVSSLFLGSMGFAHSAVVLAGDSSDDSIGEVFTSVGRVVPDETYDFFTMVFGFPAANFPDDQLEFTFPGFSAETRIDGFIGHTQAGEIFILDTGVFNNGGSIVFRSDNMTIPTDGGDLSFESIFFRASNGFVQGSDNFTRLPGFSSYSTPAAETAPFWIQWDVDLNSEGRGVTVTPIAAVSEINGALTPQEVAIAVGAIPEPSSVFHLFLGVFVLSSRRRVSV